MCVFYIFNLLFKLQSTPFCYIELSVFLNIVREHNMLFIESIAAEMVLYIGHEK